MKDNKNANPRKNPEKQTKKGSMFSTFSGFQHFKKFKTKEKKIFLLLRLVRGTYNEETIMKS